MNSFRILDRRWVSVAAVFALLVASIVPALAFAAQVTERSIALSNSSADMAGVTYQVKFTAPSTAGAVVIEFCSNSPLFGATCDAPTGFTAAGTPTTSGDFAVTPTATKVTLVGAVAQNVETTIDLTNIHNPTNAGPLYARVVSYDNGTNAANYPATTGLRDQGSIAMSITPTVGVSGAVQESLSFCIAKNAIAANCNLASNPAPTLALGETTPEGVVLQPGEVSSGSIFTQLTTNAVGGAVVNLKSGTVCGGLKRLNVNTCDIAPTGTTDITGSVATFGVKTGASAIDASGATNTNGTIRPAPAGVYSSTAYALKYTAGGADGVTSTYGDLLLDTDSAPVNNKNMELIFGASVTNQTPAGLYSTDLSLIATGKF